jgi:hypothetical protein
MGWKAAGVPVLLDGLDSFLPGWARQLAGGPDNHSWAPMVKKKSIGSIPIIDWQQKTSIRLMVVRRKKS